MRLVGDRCDSLKFQVKVPVLVYCQNNGAVGDGHDKTVELLRLISIVHCPLQGYFEANLLMWIPAPVRMDTRATDSSKDQPARMDTRRRGVRGAKCSPSS